MKRLFLVVLRVGWLRVLGFVGIVGLLVGKELVSRLVSKWSFY